MRTILFSWAMITSLLCVTLALYFFHRTTSNFIPISLTVEWTSMHWFDIMFNFRLYQHIWFVVGFKWQNLFCFFAWFSSYPCLQEFVCNPCQTCHSDAKRYSVGQTNKRASRRPGITGTNWKVYIFLPLELFNFIVYSEYLYS